MGRGKRKRKGLGDLLEEALSAFGITSERVEALIGRPCGCGERRERLNRFGRWVSRFLSGKQEEPPPEIQQLIAGEPPNPSPVPGLSEEKTRNGLDEEDGKRADTSNGDIKRGGDTSP